MRVFKGCLIGAFWFAVPFLALTALGCSSYDVTYKQGAGVGLYEWDR